jgi:hypothetical protein
VIDQATQHIIGETGDDKDDKKTGGAIQVKKVAEKKKNRVAQSFGEKYSLGVIEDDYCREKTEKEKSA